MASTRWGWRHLWGVLGLVLLAGWSPFYFAMGLVAPDWVSVTSVLLWFVLMGLAAWWLRPHPLRSLLVGVGAVVLWFVAVYLFDYLLGWTA